MSTALIHDLRPIVREHRKQLDENPSVSNDEFFGELDLYPFYYVVKVVGRRSKEDMLLMKYTKGAYKRREIFIKDLYYLFELSVDCSDIMAAVINSIFKTDPDDDEFANYVRNLRDLMRSGYWEIW